MYISRNLKLECGAEASIIVRNHTEERLRTKCFRGTFKALAGNFSRWDSSEKLFRDQEVVGHFLAELDEVWSGRQFGTHSLNIAHKAFIGWESTDELERYRSEDLESFSPNRKSSGLRVKTSRTSLFAPRTKNLTLVYELKSESGVAVAVVHSIYPGVDIGELDGNVTAREKRVFFDWEHPGQP